MGEIQCLSTGYGLYLWEPPLFVLSPSCLCNMERETELAQNAKLVYVDARQYPLYYGVVSWSKHIATLFISRMMNLDNQL